MGELKLYAIKGTEGDGFARRYGVLGYSFGRNSAEAVGRFFELVDERARSSIRHPSAEEVQVPNFKITLTPLEQKVSS